MRKQCKNRRLLITCAALFLCTVGISAHASGPRILERGIRALVVKAHNEHPWLALPCIELTHKGHRAVISRHGGQVMTYQHPKFGHILKQSSKAIVEEGTPFRGGVPVCWPCFDKDPAGVLKSHGVARRTMFDLEEYGHSSDGAPWIRLQLNGVNLPEPYHNLKLATVISLKDSLRIELATSGSGSFTQALHAYFNVAAKDTMVRGLQARSYIDKLNENRVGKPSSQPLTVPVPKPMDRVYLDAPERVAIVDTTAKRIITVNHNGNNIVTWNPGVDSGIGDLGAGDYRRMLCVEAANISPPAQVLGKHDIHRLWMEISAASY